MTSNAADGTLYSLLDGPSDGSPAGDNWEMHALERVSAHVHELAAQADSGGKAARNWESQAVERLARYLRTTAR